MSANMLPSERFLPLTQLAPLADTAARTSTFVKPDKFGRLLAVIHAGDVSASATITVIKAADTSGTSSAAVRSAALGGTTTTGDNKFALINVGHGSDFDDDTRPFFAIQAGAGLAISSAILFGVDERYGKDAVAVGTGVGIIQSVVS